MTDRSDQPRHTAANARRAPRLGRVLALAGVAIALGLAAAVRSDIARVWPQPVFRIEQIGGTVMAGKVLRTERFRPAGDDLAALPPDERARLGLDGGEARRVLYRRLDLDEGAADSIWIADFAVAGTTRPLDLFLIEREGARPVAGRIAGLILNDREIAESAITLPRLRDAHRAARARRAEIRRIGRDGTGGDTRRLAALEARDRGDRLVLEDVTGRREAIPLSRIVRFHAPNNIGLLDRLRILAARTVDALSAGPQRRAD